MAFGRTSSGKLRDAADVFTDMEKAKSRFLIKSYSRPSKAQLAEEIMKK
jgi:hypothetical protein